ncbi:hypothetical protein J3U99_22410 [Brucella pituitosa]|uniref:hypothetical protein n=1 Tax=Brucella pituitosa TaxID=571256 RepID=UPI0020042B58|nr:hypothetical protein [Brucella pituitosa]MCK4207515.1 hypothetical protein [Brucella pituitosa]
MADQTFGQALGELILQKRRALGLTQIQLSEDAYNTSAKTRRISELESGLVANPHPKTIDPIIVALKITEIEIEACAKRAAERPDKELDRAYREARNLIDAIARQFEHSQPNASLGELDDFLRAKAAEWAALRSRIANIDSSETALSTIREEAATALAEGRFSEVDMLLANAEEGYQHDRTLDEIRKLAAIRIARGDNSLLCGDTGAALLHYKSAAEFFRPFDEKEMAQNLEEMAYRIYETAKRSLQPTFFIAAALLDILIELDAIKTNPRSFAETSYRLSLVFRNDFLTQNSQNARQALDRAITHARHAASYCGKNADFEVASMSINLANCLMDRAKLALGSEISDITEVISLLEATLANLRGNADTQELRAHACNSLGAALLSLRRLDPNVNSTVTTEKALAAFYESVKVSEQHSDAENWSAGKANIGNVLAQMANENELEKYQANFLRIRAITELQAAAETFSIVAYPFQAADINEALGQVLFEHALTLGDTLAEIYLFRAIQAHETVAAVYKRQTHPMRWARSRERIGDIFAHHSRLSNAVSRENDVAKAIESFDEAATVYEELGAYAELDICSAKIAALQ